MIFLREVAKNQQGQNYNPCWCIALFLPKMSPECSMILHNVLSQSRVWGLCGPTEDLEELQFCLDPSGIPQIGRAHV